MKIEAGKKYIDRAGFVYGPIIAVDDPPYAWSGKDASDRWETWRADGMYFSDGREAQTDLVAEYVEPGSTISMCERLDDPYMQSAADALAEIRRARSLFPGDFNTLHEGMSITREEFEELWDICKQNQKVRDPAKARKEAIQLAAMALRVAVECCHEPVIRK